MNKKMIEEYNDRLAFVYDKATKEESEWSAPSRVRDAILPLVKENDYILDLGCGTGQSAEPLIGKGCRVTGVDISLQMLDLAKKHRFHKLCKYDVEKGLQGLEFGEKSFDAIIAVGVVEFIEDFAKLMNEISGLIRPEGHIVFTYELMLEENKLQYKKVSQLGEGVVDPVPEILSFKVHRHTSDEVEEILSKNGIEVISREKFIGYYKTKDKIPVYYELVLGRA